MESKAGFDSQTPTFHDDLDDRKSERLDSDDPEKNTLSEPPVREGQEAAPAGPDPNAFPDGGFEAWFCIAGGFCMTFASFGWVNCMMPILETGRLSR